MQNLLFTDIVIVFVAYSQKAYENDNFEIFNIHTKYLKNFLYICKQNGKFVRIEIDYEESN